MTFLVYFQTSEDPLHVFYTIHFFPASVSLLCLILWPMHRSQSAQILPLAGEMWHIILNLSRPLRIIFFFSRQSLIIRTYSGEHKKWVFAGCEGGLSWELSLGSNYHHQETEVWTVKAWSNALHFFPVPSLQTTWIQCFPPFFSISSVLPQGLFLAKETCVDSVWFFALYLLLAFFLSLLLQ